MRKRKVVGAKILNDAFQNRAIRSKKSSAIRDSYLVLKRNLDFDARTSLKKKNSSGLLAA